MKAIAQLNELLPAWKGLRKSAPFFGPIRNERDYTRMQSLMETLLAEVGEGVIFVVSTRTKTLPAFNPRSLSTCFVS